MVSLASLGPGTKRDRPELWHLEGRGAKQLLYFTINVLASGFTFSVIKLEGQFPQGCQALRK